MTNRNTNREEMKLLLSLRDFIIGNEEDYDEWCSSNFRNTHKNYEPYSAWLLIDIWVDENLYPQIKKKENINNPRSLFSLMEEYSSDTFYEELYGRFITIEEEEKVLSVLKKIGSPPIRTILSGRVRETHLDDELRKTYRKLIRMATPTEIEINTDTPPPKPTKIGINLKKRGVDVKW